jgi:GDP-4-dehydro-6-deoxy-D-mannose reductase
MKKIMITGFSGFVARHFLEYLHGEGLSYKVLGADIKEPELDLPCYGPVLDVRFEKLDMLDADALRRVVRGFRPDYVLHLAAFSSVAYSWKYPSACFDNNTKIFLNLADALRAEQLDCRVLSVGSSEEYGDVAPDKLPLVEEMPLNPVSPYAVARVAQEMMSKVLVNGFGMKIILTRSFNHIGPYQDERFVVPGFIRRILNLSAAEAAKGQIETGNTGIVRDFLDVRDVVRAYYLLLTEGTPGEVYNICSGKGVRLSEVIEKIADIVGVSVTGKVNPAFVRPGDNQAVVGSAAKIEAELGWTPQIPLEETLKDMVECMRQDGPPAGASCAGK